MSTDAVDSLGFAAAVAGLPEQLAEAHRRAEADVAALALPRRSFDSVVLCGMGVSGFVAEAVATVTSATIPVPVTVLQQMRVPRAVGPGTLVLAVSYGGDTEETLSMAAGALDRGAAVLGVSSGGRLAGLLADRGGIAVPVVEGLLASRVAIGALLAPVLVVLERLDLVADAGAGLTEAAAVLAARRDQCTPDVPAPRNPARELARRIGRTIPLVYGGGALGGLAAKRWKADVNTNAKAPAFWNAYPGLDHDEICAWGQHGDVTRQLLTLVELRHGHEHAVLEHRFAATRDIIEEAVHQVLTVRAAGESRLAQLLDLVHLGTWVSVHLALDAGVDPGPVDAIARLQSVLTGSTGG